MTRPSPSGIRVSDKAKASSALPSTRTDWRDPAIWARPPAASILVWRSAALICDAVTPSACMRGRSSTTRISRSTPPKRSTSAMPSTESSLLATVSSMNQLSCSSVMSSACTAKMPSGPPPVTSTLVTRGSMIPSGSWPRIWSIELLTSFTASFGSMPISNSTKVLLLPSDAVELMFFTPLILRTADSTICVT